MILCSQKVFFFSYFRFFYPFVTFFFTSSLCLCLKTILWWNGISGPEAFFVVRESGKRSFRPASTSREVERELGKKKRKKFKSGGWDLLRERLKLWRRGSSVIPPRMLADANCFCATFRQERTRCQCIGPAARRSSSLAGPFLSRLSLSLTAGSVACLSLPLKKKHSRAWLNHRRMIFDSFFLLLSLLFAHRPSGCLFCCCGGGGGGGGREVGAGSGAEKNKRESVGRD